MKIAAKMLVLVLLMALAFVVDAYPLVRLFPKRYWLAALVVAIPVLELRGRDFLHYVGANEPRIIVMSIVELLVYPVVILICAWLVRRWHVAKQKDMGSIHG